MDKRKNFKKPNNKIMTLALILVVFSTTLAAAFFGFGDNKFKIENNEGAVEVNAAKSVLDYSIYRDFSYTGEVQTYEAPYDGLYIFEAWGMQGLQSHGSQPGKGGYTKGIINLNAGKGVYIYVGGAGFNGGGWGPISSWGGSATDFRLKGGNWDDLAGLYSRIMVAGGGGSSEWAISNGGVGGGLIGGDGAYGGGNMYGTGGTQTSGGISMDGSVVYGTFGKAYYIAAGPDLGGNGGGGYWGGGSCMTAGGGGGGSSFISGHPGCIAIEGENDITPSTRANQSIHYSGLSFTDTLMLSGFRESWCYKL